MKNLLHTTSVESYYINNRKIFVKREDLCGISGSPTFSKIRGIVSHLKELKHQGINIVGYTETSISMAGWGIAWACDMLNMKAILYDPQYKHSHEVLEYHRSKWKLFSAEVIPIKAGMAKVNYYICKKLLFEKYGNKAVLLPLGLPFEETIQETSKEVLKTMKTLPTIDNIIVNIGSGTIAAGLWRALSELKYSGAFYGVLGRTSNIIKKEKLIKNKANLINTGLFQNTNVRLRIIDPGWEYTQKSEIQSPFPCHAYYDLKAWQWLVENIKQVKGTILFWNIGH